jgi:hypothetical protein
MYPQHYLVFEKFFLRSIKNKTNTQKYVEFYAIFLASCAWNLGGWQIYDQIWRGPLASADLDGGFGGLSLNYLNFN